VVAYGHFTQRALKCCIAAKGNQVGICPTGAFGEFLSSPLPKKYFASVFQKYMVDFSSSRLDAMALQPIVTERGAGCSGRDAVVCA
jgi:hypothetical protein